MKPKPTAPGHRLYWMTMDHPSLRLYLEERPENSANWHAWFDSHAELGHGVVTQKEMIPIIAQGLRRELRFANQMRTPVTVLYHEMAMFQYLKTIGSDPILQDQSLFHDTPEALGFGDIPAMMKAEVDEVRETAIYNAFKWPVPILHAGDSQEAYDFKRLDRIAACAEATLHGKYEWVWMKTAKEEHGEQFAFYLDFLRTFTQDLDVLEQLWIQEVTRVCTDAKTLHIQYTSAHAATATSSQPAA